MPSSVLLLHPWAGASLLPCAHLWALHPRLALVGVEGTVLSTPLPTRELLFLLCLCHPQAVPASTSPVQLSLKLHLGDVQTPVVLQFLCLDILSWKKFVLGVMLVATGGIFTHPSALLVLWGCPTAARCQPPPAGSPLVGVLRGAAGTPVLP